MASVGGRQRTPHCETIRVKQITSSVRAGQVLPGEVFLPGEYGVHIARWLHLGDTVQGTWLALPREGTWAPRPR
jgi:hypothetical protein